jgi:hypothetical protein
MNEDIKKLLDAMTPEQRLQVVKYVEERDNLLWVSFPRERFISSLLKRGIRACPEGGWDCFKAFIEDFCQSDEIFSSLVESFVDAEMGAGAPAGR